MPSAAASARAHTSSTAAAAAITSGLPLYVPKCHILPWVMVFMMSARPPNAASGRPPPMLWPA